MSLLNTIAPLVSPTLPPEVVRAMNQPDPTKLYGVPFRPNHQAAVKNLSRFDRTAITYTVLGCSVDVDVYYVYSPAEKPTRDYPGCPAELEVQCIQIGRGPYRVTVDFCDLDDDEAEKIEHEIKYKIMTAASDCAGD